MKHSIGLWTDSRLQKYIKCSNNEKLKDIYEKMYSDPKGSLNQIRQETEKLFKDFFNKNAFGGTKFPDRLASTNKLINSLIKQYYSEKFNGDTEKINSTLDLIYSYGSLVRVYGNSGSHNGEIIKEELAMMAVVSFMAYFELYKIFNDKTEKDINCKSFNDLIYDELKVIYNTKEDLEEWERIKYNKLQYNYNLFHQDLDYKNKKIDLSEIIEIEKSSQIENKKNVYFISLPNFKRIKKMYKNLNEIEEENYFYIDENINEIDIIDIIPLCMNSNDNNPYNWDMCYINISIEFDDFGVDLVIFLNFNHEKFNIVKEKYNIEIQEL